MSPDDLITTAEACRILGIDRSTLNRWAQPGPSRKITPAERLTVGGPHGAYRYHRRDVEVLKVELEAKALKAELEARAAAS